MISWANTGTAPSAVKRAAPREPRRDLSLIILFPSLHCRAERLTDPSAGALFSAACQRVSTAPAFVGPQPNRSAGPPQAAARPLIPDGQPCEGVKSIAGSCFAAARPCAAHQGP